MIPIGIALSVCRKIGNFKGRTGGGAASSDDIGIFPLHVGCRPQWIDRTFVGGTPPLFMELLGDWKGVKSNSGVDGAPVLRNLGEDVFIGGFRSTGSLGH